MQPQTFQAPRNVSAHAAEARCHEDGNHGGGISLFARTRVGSAPEQLCSFQVDCVERMLQHVPNMFEAGTVRCLNPSCSDVVPFGNIKALAYHMTVKHVKRERNGKPIPCLLCSKKFMT